jgi:hypothetical protein
MAVMTNTAAILIPTGEPEIVPARVRDSPMRRRAVAPLVHRLA